MLNIDQDSFINDLVFIFIEQKNTKSKSISNTKAEGSKNTWAKDINKRNDKTKDSKII